MFTTILLIVLVVLALVLFFVGSKSKSRAEAVVEAHNTAVDNAASQERGTYGGYSRNSVTHKRAVPFGKGGDEVGYLPAWLGAIPLTLALIFGAFACTSIVEARSEGVPVAFGKIGSTMDNGLNVHAPWVDVIEMDGTNKTSRFVNSKKDDTDNTFQHSAIDVRLSDNSESTAYATVRWHRAEGSASDVYAEYRGDDPMTELRENVVNGVAQAAVVEAMSQYNPTEAIDTLDVDFSDPQAVADALKTLDLAPDYPALSKIAQDYADDLLGGEPLVVFDSIRITKTTMPERSQDRVDAFFAEISDIQVALARRAKNAAQAAAANELKESLADNPLVLVSRCFDLIEAGQFKPPVGFQCWSGAENLPLVSNVPVPNAS